MPDCTFVLQDILQWLKAAKTQQADAASPAAAAAAASDTAQQLLQAARSTFASMLSNEPCPAATQDAALSAAIVGAAGTIRNLMPKLQASLLQGLTDNNQQQQEVEKGGQQDDADRQHQELAAKQQLLQQEGLQQQLQLRALVQRLLRLGAIHVRVQRFTTDVQVGSGTLSMFWGLLSLL
jgi:hypothetical protein